MIIRIKEEDIVESWSRRDGGSWKTTGDCPVAVAVKRQLGFPQVSTAGYLRAGFCIWPHDGTLDGYRWDWLPEAVIQFQNDYDNRKDVQPFEFELPEPYVMGNGICSQLATLEAPCSPSPTVVEDAPSMTTSLVSSPTK